MGKLKEKLETADVLFEEYDWFKKVFPIAAQKSSDGFFLPGFQFELVAVSKNINSNNIGNIINSAEINSASNNMSLSDIDSVPGNHSNGEDDKSTAEVLISIRTGRVVGYTILIIAIIVILGVGIYFIKKDVLNTGNKQK